MTDNGQGEQGAQPSSDSGFSSGSSARSNATSDTTMTSLDTNRTGSDATLTGTQSQAGAGITCPSSWQQQTVLDENASNRRWDRQGPASVSTDSGILSSSFGETRGPDLRGGEENRTSRTSQWVDESYQVFLKNMDGKTHTIEVKQTDTVEIFESRVSSKLGQNMTQCRFTTAEGRTLERGRGLTMAKLNIKEHSTIYAQGRLRGGGAGVA